MPWKEQLQSALINKLGAEKGEAIYSKYENAFHTSYSEDVSLEEAINDILQLEQLSDHKPFEIDLYERTEVQKEILHLRIFQYRNPIPLSDILPILENMDLRILNEHPYEVHVDGEIHWISDFNVIYMKNASLELSKLKPLFQDAFAHIISGACENDGFNKLVLDEGLNWQEISILRAYAKYLRQTKLHFSQEYMEETLSTYSGLSRDLVNYFKLRFELQQTDKIKISLEELEKSILRTLDGIVSLEQDQIMRYLFTLIKATLRTNFLHLMSGKNKQYLSFKLNSAEVPELPLPRLLYEIFVYSPRFHGIHLRASKVARGGIRWSDRREDLRTEILGLMKTQKVKNAVIVPSGAKGGFVLKALPAIADRKILEQEVVDCYKLFIRGLLDLTDNIIGDKTIHPKDVLCYDDYDPYLVVAADKGTGAFSDIANSISKEYDFWLGDAFASGGATGYNHKAMGITARGAWESIRRHFRELDFNMDDADFTVVGIGDMSGDVFGNGMLYSNHIKLVAAFDHRDIFIDPHPDPVLSFQERKRLFELPRSSWQDYDKKLISAGGGIFSRKSKSIQLTVEIQKVLDIKDKSLQPNELIKALLKAPVDLLYNGGIGTYVKSRMERKEDVGDRTNDECRVNGEELRCKIVGEGGNLGFTQLGRIEYATKGGLIFTDSIDNSGGVDCSDHEVNMKILLDQVIKDGQLTLASRNELLQTLEGEVAELILKDNFSQALIISMFALRATHYAGLYQNYIRELEIIGELDRGVEFLPDDKIILERKAAGLGITRPELSVLLAYTKIYVKKEIVKSNLPDDLYLKRYVEAAFPKALRELYREYMYKHRLYREIIATQLSNQVVNEMGITFIHREQEETGATIPEVIRAYTISSQVFETVKLAQMIEGLNFKVLTKLRYDLLHHIRHLLNLSTRWFLRSRHLQNDIAKTIELFAVPVKKLAPMVSELMSGNTREYLDSLAEHFIAAGIPAETASQIATYRAIYILLNVIEIANTYQFDLAHTAKVYFHVGAKFNFVWFRDHIANDLREGHWNNMSRLRLRDELDLMQKKLTIAILENSQQIEEVDNNIDAWMKKHPRAIDRWEKILQLIHGSSSVDYAMFFVALRELSDWV